MNSDANHSGSMPPPASPPALDPPFRGYIETTYDALLVFEAARRGMIPRVTRRLIERERGMVQSGAVFVFDEHESGIKRWTDGLVWSPSRILGNFLVYRETDKRRNSGNGNDQDPNKQATTVAAGSQGRPGLSAASITGLDYTVVRQRCVSDGQSSESLDKNRERQLVGSLTNSYKFKDGGLVKKTMSVNVNGFAQHMVSYYSVADVLNGRLRTPSSISELVSLEISPEYMQKQNFRFPPVFDIGPDGLLQYKGELEESNPQPQTPYSAVPMSGASQGSYGPSTGDVDYSRPSTASAGVLTPISPAGYSSYPQGGYFEQQQSQYASDAASSSSDSLARAPTGTMVAPPPMIRQASDSSVRSNHSSLRASRRYDPYSHSPVQSHYPPQPSKSPAFQGVRSPSLPGETHRSSTEQASVSYIAMPDNYGYRDMSLPPGAHPGIPTSAPGHFPSFPEVSPVSEPYHHQQAPSQHMSVAVPQPLRPSSAATVRHYGTEMTRSFSSPVYHATPPPPQILQHQHQQQQQHHHSQMAPQQHTNEAQIYPNGYGWIKRDPDAVPIDELNWNNGNKQDGLEYGSVRY